MALLLLDHGDMYCSSPSGATVPPQLKATYPNVFLPLPPPFFPFYQNRHDT